MKRKILLYIFSYLFIDILLLFIVTNFECKGNPPMKWNELKIFLPILLVTTAIIAIISYIKSNNDKS